MATVIRIKRRLNEEPTENICIKSKRARLESEHDGPCDPADNKTSTVLIRVGTVKSKEEPLEPLVIDAIKKGWELRENYKKLGSERDYKQNTRQEAKKRSVSKRYKIITQSRGIGEVQPPSDELSAADENTKNSKADVKNEQKASEGAEAFPTSSTDFNYFDAVLASDKDIITCNGIPMESEKYVYDVFYSAEPVDWADVMERNMCEIESMKESFQDTSDSDKDDHYDDEDDENEESNWRNDYPDYDDSPYEDEEDYLNAQIKKLSCRKYDTDESYDIDDYDDDSFDEDGNLIVTSGSSSLSKLMRRTRLEDSDSEEEEF